MSVEKLKRIDLSRVKEAFQTAGITDPARKINTKCVWAAFLYPESAYWRNAKAAGFDVDYYVGVVVGWDDNKETIYDNIKYKLGCSDGREAAKIMGL